MALTSVLTVACDARAGDGTMGIVFCTSSVVLEGDAEQAIDFGHAGNLLDLPSLLVDGIILQLEVSLSGLTLRLRCLLSSAMPELLCG